MWNIELETIRAIVLGIILGYLIHIGRQRNLDQQTGWTRIVYGFGLTFFGAVLDITDNFSSLSHYVVIGNTPTEAFLEKVVGYLGGSSFMLWGLVQWIPFVQDEKNRSLSTLETEALRASRERLNEAQRIAHVGSYEWNPVTGELYWSDELFRLFGLEPQSFKPTLERLHELIHPDDLPNVKQAINSAINDGKECDSTYRVFRRDGAERVMYSHGEVTFDQDGTATLMIGSVADITERRKIEQELRITATAFETQEGMIVTDKDNIILRVNRSFTKLTGYSQDEVVGKTPAILKSGHHDKEFYKGMWEKLLRDKFWQGEVMDRRKDGAVYPKWLTITAITGEYGEIINYVASFVDISRYKAAEARIHALAFYDELTGLPNRRLLMDRLRHALAISARHDSYGGILFIDLDNFKSLNDTQGHDVGDMLLVEVANRLKSTLRDEDTVARLGGDEFVVMMENISPVYEEAAVHAEYLAGRIQSAINQPFLLKNYEHHSSPSIGICLFHGAEETTDDVLKRADSAMYQSKQSGRNTIRFFDPAMQEALEARTHLEAWMRIALSKDNEFRLHYQVQVNAERRPIGAEALLRWQHPQHGLIPPIRFISLAEETGLILPLGQWVLETACAQLKAWEANLNAKMLTLAVNVSARQFRQPDFVSQVKTIVAQSGIDPSKLKLELTESLVLHNVTDTIEKMQELKIIGINFSMDDFGTGHSSLSYLKRLPLDQLKIDQSFVRDIATDPSDEIIVKTIITMGHTLGLQVIAEGVETEDHFEYLRQNDCEAFQGYLFGQALEAGEFAQLLDTLGKS